MLPSPIKTSSHTWLHTCTDYSARLSRSLGQTCRSHLPVLLLEVKEMESLAFDGHPGHSVSGLPSTLKVSIPRPVPGELRKIGNEYPLGHSWTFRDPHPGPPGLFSTHLDDITLCDSRDGIPSLETQRWAHTNDLNPLLSSWHSDQGSTMPSSPPLLPPN